jgi:hypothetical protein
VASGTAGLRGRSTTVSLRAGHRVRPGGYTLIARVTSQRAKPRTIRQRIVLR